MDAIAQTDFPDIRAEYKPKAIYLEDADTVEYVKLDVACVYRRIDDFLTLALDLKSRDLIGFRFKGFKNFFLKHLKPKYKLVDGDFISLVSVIEAALEVICDEVLCDQERRNAYRTVRRMAHDDRVALDEPMLMAA